MQETRLADEPTEEVVEAPGIAAEGLFCGSAGANPRRWGMTSLPSLAECVEAGFELLIGIPLFNPFDFTAFRPSPLRSGCTRPTARLGIEGVRTPASRDSELRVNAENREPLLADSAFDSGYFRRKHGPIGQVISDPYPC